MKITVGIPSRGRHLELAAAILSLHRTKSQSAHEVEYLVAHDHNDPQTLDVITKLIERGLPVRSSFGPPPIYQGALLNRLIAETPADSVFLIWTDRLIPLNADWDESVAYSVMQHPSRVLWLDCVHLAGPGMFILPPAWRAALPGQACPAVFPFWFDDSHIEEVSALVHGMPRFACWAKCAGPRIERTNRMRDLPFWIGVFGALRHDRLLEARQIARNLGIIMPPPEQTMAHFDLRDREFLLRAPALEERYGALGEPDAGYQHAKSEAEHLMMKMGIAA